MELKPIMELASSHQKTILMIFVFFLLITVLNIASMILASKRSRILNPASAILVISNGFLAMASTLLLALCVLFFDTSKTLYDSFDYLVSRVLLPITILIDVLEIVGILVFAFMVIHYRRKV